MIKKELNEILEKHVKWLNDELGGVRADLRYADLGNANLNGADLRYADLRDTNLGGADLRDANFMGANFMYANLMKANLRGANLNGAELRYADLRDTNLSGADLRCADLSDTNLNGAELRYADLRKTRGISIACPTDGPFVGWKVVSDKLIKLLIPEDAKRSSATSNKCRCDKAYVLGIYNCDGSISEVSEILNTRYEPVLYQVNKYVYPDYFDENRWNECSHGIHFFIDKQAAISYAIN